MEKFNSKENYLNTPDPFLNETKKNLENLKETLKNDPNKNFLAVQRYGGPADLVNGYVPMNMEYKGIKIDPYVTPEELIRMKFYALQFEVTRKMSLNELAKLKTVIDGSVRAYGMFNPNYSDPFYHFVLQWLKNRAGVNIGYVFDHYKRKPTSPVVSKLEEFNKNFSNLDFASLKELIFTLDKLKNDYFTKKVDAPLFYENEAEYKFYDLSDEEAFKLKSIYKSLKKKLLSKLNYYDSTDELRQEFYDKVGFYPFNVIHDLLPQVDYQLYQVITGDRIRSWIESLNPEYNLLPDLYGKNGNLLSNTQIENLKKLNKYFDSEIVRGNFAKELMKYLMIWKDNYMHSSNSPVYKLIVDVLRKAKFSYLNSLQDDTELISAIHDKAIKLAKEGKLKKNLEGEYVYSEKVFNKTIVISFSERALDDFMPSSLFSVHIY